MGVLEGSSTVLGGVLEANMGQDRAKMAQEPLKSENPRELPSGLSPPERVLEALGGIWEGLEGVLEASWGRLGGQDKPRWPKNPSRAKILENYHAD